MTPIVQLVTKSLRGTPASINAKVAALMAALKTPRESSLEMEEPETYHDVFSILEGLLRVVPDADDLRLTSVSFEHCDRNENV